MISNRFNEDIVDIIIELFSWNEFERFIDIKFNIRISSEININQGDRFKVGDAVAFFRKKGKLDLLIINTFAYRQNAKFHDFLKQLPTTLSVQAYYEANIKPLHHRCYDIASFDLVSTLTQSLTAISPDNRISAISIECSIDKFISSFCKRLKEEIDRKYGPVQLRDLVAVRSFGHNAVATLVHLKQLANTLRCMHVICPILIDPELAMSFCEIWNEIKIYYKHYDNRLILILFSNSNTIFPNDISKIHPPQFNSEQVLDWMHELRIINNWSMDLILTWQMMCPGLLNVSGNTSMERVYDHISYLSQNIPNPPFEHAMLQVMEEWKNFYVNE